jgi:hypothetical protein
MAKPKGPSKLQEAAEAAVMAFETSQSAMAMARAHGLILEGLLQVLRVSGVLSQEGAEKVFHAAVAVIDENPPADPNSAAMVQVMRRVIGEIAEIHGVKLPAPDQAGGAPKH